MVRRNRSRKPRTVSAPVARAAAPGRASKYPPVPFTGTERLLSLSPNAQDGVSYIRSFAWNPGLAETFSTGHYQAQNFDKYEVTGRNSITYTPSCSTLTPGSVYVLFDYDPNDPAPQTEDEFADNELTKTCSMYSTMTAVMDPLQLDNCKMLIRTGPSATDKLLTDPCAIHIGAFGYGSNVVTEGLTLGHFHINYSAKLLVRQPLTDSVPPPRTFAISEPLGGAFETGTTEFIQALTVNTLGATDDGIRISPPPGWYHVHSRAGMTVPATSGPLPTTFVSLEVHRNSARVGRSQAVENQNFTQSEVISLSSLTPILIEKGDYISQVLVHDSENPISVQTDRCLFTLELI